MDGDTLDLNRVTPEMLKDLSPTNLNIFMDSYLGSRDFEEVASRLQGAVQLGWLQNPPEGWSEDDVQTAVIWVETTILNNGQR